MGKAVKALYAFGPFRLDTTEHLLLRDGEPVPLTPKAFDILLALVQNSGHLLHRDELMQEVWPDTVVEENNLSQNISALRKALGEVADQHQYIETVPRRGYRFVADVKELADERLLIIERHTRSRIVIEEEETNGENSAAIEPVAGQGPLEGTAAASHLRRRGVQGYRKLLLFGPLIILACVAILYGWLHRPARSKAALEIKTVAVLPLKSLDPNEQDQSLGLKLADALIQRLGRLGRFVVRPTGAVQRYDGKTLDSLAAGREQQVDVVLDGSFQHADKRLRLRMQLLRVSDGQQLWASTFDERSTDPFYLEDALAEQTAQALVPQLSGDERQLVVRHDTENAEANRLYTEGRYYWNKRTEQGFEKAIEFFDQAIDKDPDYARAYAGLADCYALLSVWCALPPNEALVKARTAALQATTIDQSLAEAHTSLAFAKWIYDRDWAGAEEEFRQAIHLNPSYPTAHHWYSYFLAAMERFDEAISEIKQARDLDELSPSINTDVGEIYCWARRYGDAIEQLQAVLKNEPNFPPARNVLGMTYIKMGRLREGVAELEAARRLDNGPRVLSALGCAYGLSGLREQARGVLGELEARSKQRYISPFSRALVEVGLGDKERAFASLEDAFNEHSDSIVILKVYPWLDSLRSDPRFVKLLRRIGIPQ